MSFFWVSNWWFHNFFFLLRTYILSRFFWTELIDMMWEILKKPWHIIKKHTREENLKFFSLSLSLSYAMDSRYFEWSFYLKYICISIFRKISHFFAFINVWIHIQIFSFLWIIFHVEYNIMNLCNIAKFIKLWIVSFWTPFLYFKIPVC
jgi:hypothetical protein